MNNAMSKYVNCDGRKRLSVHTASLSMSSSEEKMIPNLIVNGMNALQSDTLHRIQLRRISSRRVFFNNAITKLQDHTLYIIFVEV